MEEALRVIHRARRVTRFDPLNLLPPDYLAWREQRTHKPDSALPGGESLRAFAERATLAATTAHDLAAKHGTMLIVSHRLLTGAVAAVHDGVHHPAEVFGYASDFQLRPAHPLRTLMPSTGDPECPQGRQRDRRSDSARTRAR